MRNFFFMFWTLIWIPHKILSILSVHTRGKNEILPPIVCEKKMSKKLDQMWPRPSENFGPFEAGGWGGGQGLQLGGPRGLNAMLAFSSFMRGRVAHWSRAG